MLLNKLLANSVYYQESIWLYYYFGQGVLSFSLSSQSLRTLCSKIMFTSVSALCLSRLHFSSCSFIMFLFLTIRDVTVLQNRKLFREDLLKILSLYEGLEPSQFPA